jgi:endonuclease III-like uncharacterized protein
MHYIKRLRQKTFIYSKRLFDSNRIPKKDPQQTSLYLICKKIIANENTTLHIAPVSGKRYIRQEKGNLFIIIGKETIEIINHVYSYIIPMNSIVLEKITKTFDTRMEEIRNNMENEIKNNIQKSLAQLLRDLSKNGH